MALNAVQFDMLCLENKLMIRGERTWFRHSRHKECELLGKFFGRHIGKSWLDDNRGALKANGFHRSWQRGLHAEDGTFEGSESRRQFTYKACDALGRRGIKVFRQVWHALKKTVTPPKTATTEDDFYHLWRDVLPGGKSDLKKPP